MNGRIPSSRPFFTRSDREKPEGVNETFHAADAYEWLGRESETPTEGVSDSDSRDRRWNNTPSELPK